MARGMSQTMWIVIGALVILVVALVVLTIFTGGVGKAGALSKFRENCELQYRSSCSSLCTMPITWTIPVLVKEGSQAGQMKSCDQELQGKNCQDPEFKCNTPPPAAGPVVASG